MDKKEVVHVVASSKFMKSMVFCFLKFCVKQSLVLAMTSLQFVLLISSPFFEWEGVEITNARWGESL